MTSSAEHHDVKEKQPFSMRTFLRKESPQDFDQALALRLAVFVQEQGVPEVEERDGYDDEARHWLFQQADIPVATGRMVSYQEGCQMRPVAKIGRITVRRSHRDQGLGKRLMLVMIETARREGFDQAIVDAQVPVLGFYEKLGFVAEGDEFMDGGIPHYRMRLVLN